MFESEALKSLGAFPIVQAAVGIVVILTALYLMRRGEKDRKAVEPIPQWLMMGPLHDMMQAVHDVAEQSRRSNDLLERLDQSLLACKVALELIRDESRLR